MKQKMEKLSAKQNLESKYKRASESLLNFFDVYKGVDSSKAQGKSVEVFDER